MDELCYSTVLAFLIPVSVSTRETLLLPCVILMSSPSNWPTHNAKKALQPAQSYSRAEIYTKQARRTKDSFYFGGDGVNLGYGLYL